MQVDVYKILVRFKKTLKLAIRRITEPRQQKSVDCLLKKSDYDTRDNVNKNRAFPLVRFKREFLREPQKQRTQGKPDVARNHLPGQDLPERNGISRELILEGKLAGKKESEQRPDCPNRTPFHPFAFDKRFFGHFLIEAQNCDFGNKSVMKGWNLLTKRKILS